MTDALVDGRGGRLDLLVRAGADMPTVTLDFTASAGGPLDLTGATLICRAATREDTPQEIVLVPAVIGDATLGVVGLDMAEEEIAKLPAPATVSSRPRTGGEWVLDLQTAGGQRIPLLYGELLVAADATT